MNFPDEARIYRIREIKELTVIACKSHNCRVAAQDHIRGGISQLKGGKYLGLSWIAHIDDDKGKSRDRLGSDDDSNVQRLRASLNLSQGQCLASDQGSQQQLG